MQFICHLKISDATIANFGLNQLYVKPRNYVYIVDLHTISQTFKVF